MWTWIWFYSLKVAVKTKTSQQLNSLKNNDNNNNKRIASLQMKLFVSPENDFDTFGLIRIFFPRWAFSRYWKTCRPPRRSHVDPRLVSCDFWKAIPAVIKSIAAPECLISCDPGEQIWLQQAFLFSKQSQLTPSISRLPLGLDKLLKGLIYLSSHFRCCTIAIILPLLCHSTI